MNNCTEGRFLQKTGSFLPRLSAQAFPVNYGAVSSMIARIWCPGSDNRARRLLLFAFLTRSPAAPASAAPTWPQGAPRAAPGERRPGTVKPVPVAGRGAAETKTSRCRSLPHPSLMKFEPWAGFETLWWMINREMALVKQRDFCRAHLWSCIFCSSRLLISPPCVSLMGNNQQMYLCKQIKLA